MNKGRKTYCRGRGRIAASGEKIEMQGCFIFQGLSGKKKRGDAGQKGEGWRKKSHRLLGVGGKLMGLGHEEPPNPGDEDLVLPRH